MLVNAHEAESGVLARLARRALSAKRALGAHVFDLAVPAEAQLRAAILAGGSFDADSPDGLPSEEHAPSICRRWERPARFLARQLTRRRRLASFWKGPLTHGARPAWAASAGIDGGRMSQLTEPLLVFSASLVDRSGAAVERHPIAVRVAGRLGSSGSSEILLNEVRHLAARRLTARVRRLNRLLRDRRRRELARDKAIDEVLRAADRAAHSQPGLFHRAPEQTVDARQSPDGAEHLEEVSVGPVTLVAVMASRS